jgi:hypothetical protein
MIYVLASTYKAAKMWASAQHLKPDEWFSTLDESELYGRENFHTIVLENASDLPSMLFERLFNLAQMRGRMNNGSRVHAGRSQSDDSRSDE